MSLTPEIHFFVSVSKHSTELRFLLDCVDAPPIMYIKVPIKKAKNMFMSNIFV
jgi:hypothetical protein